MFNFNILKSISQIVFKLVVLSIVLAMLAWTVPSNLTRIDTGVTQIQGARDAEVV
jgi:regulatory protein YycH of two-component signal transduction system YycFG